MNNNKLKDIEKYFNCLHYYGRKIITLDELLLLSPLHHQFIVTEVHYILDGAGYVLYYSTLQSLLEYDDPLKYLWKLTSKYD